MRFVQSIARLVAFASMASTTLAQQLPPSDRPPAMLPGSCPQIKFDFTQLVQPTREDFVVHVTAEGRLASVEWLSTPNDAKLRDAVLTQLKGCKYEHGIADGIPAQGKIRLIANFGWPRGQERSPRVENIESCSPTEGDYPLESRRKNESGTTRIRITVDREGRTLEASIARSSGFSQLDEIALGKISTCKVIPALSYSGAPIAGTLDVDYVWVLK